MKNLNFLKIHGGKLVISQLKPPLYCANNNKSDLNKENVNLNHSERAYKKNYTIENTKKSSKRTLCDKGSKTPRVFCEKTIDENIKNISFKNRNLCEVIRIREEEISKKVDENAKGLIETIKSEKKIIKKLYLQLNSLETKKESLVGSETGCLIRENKMIEQNIAKINDIINDNKEGNVKFEDYLKMKQIVSRLDEGIDLQFNKLISNQKEIKELCRNNSSSMDDIKNIQLLSDINMLIHHLSLFVHKKFGYQLYEKDDEIKTSKNKDRESVQSLVKQIYNKLFILRTKTTKALSQNCFC